MVETEHHTTIFGWSPYISLRQHLNWAVLNQDEHCAICFILGSILLAKKCVVIKIFGLFSQKKTKLNMSAKMPQSTYGLKATNFYPILI